MVEVNISIEIHFLFDSSISSSSGLTKHTTVNWLDAQVGLPKVSVVAYKSGP